jgi:VanZ family protein
VEQSLDAVDGRVAGAGGEAEAPVRRQPGLPCGPGRPLGPAALARPLWRRWLPVGIWLAVIFFASTAIFVPERTSAIINPILRTLFPHLDEAGIDRLHLMVRKAGHVTEYSILAILLARATWAIAMIRRGWFGISLAVLACVAASDEFHQTFVPGRNGSVSDVLLDIAAGAAALSMIALWRWTETRVDKSNASLSNSDNPVNPVQNSA